MVNFRTREPDGQVRPWLPWILGGVIFVFVVLIPWGFMASNDSSNISEPAWGIIPWILLILGLLGAPIAIIVLVSVNITAINYWIPESDDEIDQANYKRKIKKRNLAIIVLAIVTVVTWLLFILEIIFFS